MGLADDPPCSGLCAIGFGPVSDGQSLGDRKQFVSAVRSIDVVFESSFTGNLLFLERLAWTIASSADLPWVCAGGIGNDDDPITAGLGCLGWLAPRIFGSVALMHVYNTNSRLLAFADYTHGGFVFSRGGGENIWTGVGSLIGPKIGLRDLFGDDGHDWGGLSAE